MVSVLQTIDTNHEDIVHDAQMDYFGTLLATASADETIRIFDVQNKRNTIIAELKGHEGPVWGVSWSHPMYGNLLASCSYDKKVIIWGETEGRWEQIYEYADHLSSVNCVSWAPHEFGLVFACGSSDGSISIVTCCSNDTWTAVKIEDAHSVGVNALSWAPVVDIDFMLNPSNKQSPSNLPKRLVSAGCDTFVKIWSEEQFTPDVGGGGGGQGSTRWVLEARLSGHSDWVRDVAWAPGLSLASQQIASCGQDGRLIVWQCSGASGSGGGGGGSINRTPAARRVAKETATAMVTATPTTRATVPSNADAAWSHVLLHTYQDVIWHVSWSLTGNVLAVSGGDNKVTLWKESLEGNWFPLTELNRNTQGSSANPLYDLGTSSANASAIGGTGGVGGGGSSTQPLPPPQQHPSVGGYSIGYGAGATTAAAAAAGGGHYQAANAMTSSFGGFGVPSSQQSFSGMSTPGGGGGFGGLPATMSHSIAATQFA